MTISRTGARTCSDCGRPLTDATSRLFRLGPECRRGMTPAQLRAALVAAARDDDPFAVPAERAPSPRARHVNAVARAVVEQARAPESARCHHGGIPGACPKCRREADPTRAAERILAEIKAEPFEDRRAERLARFAARYALPQRTTYGA